MSIFSMVYEELQAKVKHLPKYSYYAEALDALDREQISDIILDGNTFWFEYSHFNDVTDKQHALLVNYLVNHHGYKYLYEMAAA